MSTGARPEDKAGHLPPTAVRRLLNNLAVGWVEGNLFHRFDKLTTGRWICSGRGMRFFPETQVLKDLFDDIRLVDD